MGTLPVGAGTVLVDADTVPVDTAAGSGTVPTDLKNAHFLHCVALAAIDLELGTAAIFLAGSAHVLEPLVAAACSVGNDRTHTLAAGIVVVDGTVEPTTPRLALLLLLFGRTELGLVLLLPGLALLELVLGRLELVLGRLAALEVRHYHFGFVLATERSLPQALASSSSFVVCEALRHRRSQELGPLRACLTPALSLRARHRSLRSRVSSIDLEASRALALEDRPSSTWPSSSSATDRWFGSPQDDWSVACYCQWHTELGT